MATYARSESSEAIYSLQKIVKTQAEQSRVCLTRENCCLVSFLAMATSSSFFLGFLCPIIFPCESNSFGISIKLPSNARRTVRTLVANLGGSLKRTKRTMWKFAEETTTDREKPAENEHLKILKTLYLHVNVESSLSC